MLAPVSSYHNMNIWIVCGVIAVAVILALIVYYSNPKD